MRLVMCVLGVPEKLNNGRPSVSGALTRFKRAMNTFIVTRTFILILSHKCVHVQSERERQRWHKCICASYFKCTHSETAAVTVTNRQPKVLSLSCSNLSKIVLAGRWLLILSACTLWTRVYSSTAPVLCSSLCLLMANMLKTTYS